MPGLSDLLHALGIPAGIATVIIVGALIGDRLLKFFADSTAAKTQQSNHEREQLSTDQENFRRAMLTQVDQLRTQIATQATALDAAAARHLDYERRIAEFQITTARLAGPLIAHNVALPAGTLPPRCLGVLLQRAHPLAGRASTSG